MSRFAVADYHRRVTTTRVTAAAEPCGPQDADVLVYVATLPLAPPFTSSSACLGLDALENQRAARFVFPIDRARYVTSHLVLHHVLGRHLGLAPAAVAFAPGPAGTKPRLAGTDLAFNLSQAGTVAAVAVARGREVGVDVEVESAIDKTPIEGQLAPGERAALQALSPDERCVAMRRLWVRKEAYLKACGVGLGGGPARTLESFEMSVGEVPRLIASAAGDRDAWVVTSIAVPSGYQGALVHARSVPGDGTSLSSPTVTVRQLAWSEVWAEIES